MLTLQTGLQHGLVIPSTIFSNEEDEVFDRVARLEQSVV